MLVMIEGRPVRGMAVRALWLALLLAVLAHVTGCVHGPLSNGPGRVDATALTAPSAPPAPQPTPRPAPLPAPESAAPGACGHRHQVQECAGIDVPALPQTDGAKVPPLASASLDVAEVPGARPVRAPPGHAGPRPGAGPRALLQVWRN
ncbi:hypothetical protein [Streptomyces sp. NPDC057702]|uniref:hypothetical protein n=1 Tax=unclassified Streptomyces TaxID=2593676 RepID=UPI0036BAC04D